LAKKTGNNPGDVVRYVPAPEPMVAAISIAILSFIEVVFSGLFIWGLVVLDNSVGSQQMLAFWLASALLTLAAILSLYRKFFLPDVMIVKKRKLKYEDLM
jgi:hypothetical protein